MIQFKPLYGVQKDSLGTYKAGLSYSMVTSDVLKSFYI